MAKPGARPTNPDGSPMTQRDVIRLREEIILDDTKRNRTSTSTRREYLSQLDRMEKQIAICRRQGK